MIKKIAERGLVAVFVAVFVCFGVYISHKSPKFSGITLVRAVNPISRDPAAIHKSYDFSQLDGDELEQASKQRLISGASVQVEGESVGVELGDFVVKGTAGEKNFICQKFAQIVLQFEGDGSATSGQKPQMEVEGKCEVSRDISMISPLWIPVAKILGEPVADGEFDFREDHPIRVRFANVVQEWPLAWRLKGLKLIDPEHPGHEVNISDEEVLKMSGAKPLILTFKK